MPLPATCPRCSSGLERGHIAGQSIYLNWIPEGESVGVTALGKEHLATGSLLRAPQLPAARCPSCGLGVF
ncbi:PF20097 family protein [Blastococcus sp. SYSU DS1021]